MLQPRRIAVTFAACIGAMAASAAAAQTAASEGLTETFHAVTLSRGGSLNVIVSKRSGATPSTAALLFPGYPGILRIRREGDGVLHELHGNFLVRARRHLNNQDVFTVMVDCPLDQWTSCDDRYRSSPQHAGDIADVVDAVKKDFGAKQAYLLGTSYGTVSTAFLARQLEGKIAGAVHTASFTDPRAGANAHGAPMGGFDWTMARVPQLFVHHRDDPCDVTRYSSIAERRKDLPLITVEGSVNARGAPCQAQSAHGFAGRERATMAAIGEWMLHRRLVTPVGE